MKIKLGLFIVILAALVVSDGFAMDIGVMRPAETQYSAEIVYESYERDVRSTYPISHEHYTSVQDEQRAIVRFKYSPQPNWGLAVDAGATDSEYSEGYAPLFGLAGHVIVYQKNGFYTALFAKGTYAFDIEYKDTYNYSGADWSETISEKQTEELWEYGGGIQLGQDWTPCSAVRITAYTGAMLTFINSSEYIKDDYTLSDEHGVTTWAESNHDFKIEEDQPLSFFAGVEATLTKYEIGIRAESRFHDRTSFSAGLFKNF